MPGFSLFEGLVQRENDYALIISLNSVNSLAFVEAYTPILSLDSSTLSRIYLSACDSPDTKSSTYPNTTYTHADSTTSPSTTSPSDHLTPYTDLFLSAKKKYKPVAKKVRPVIGELPEKFRIEHKIIGNPLNDLPTLNPNPPPFTPTDRYTHERRDQLDKNHPGNFLWPAERNLMHNFMLAHDSGFAWSEQERGSFRTDFFPPVDFPVVPHTPWVERNFPIPPGIYEDVCAIVQKKLAAGIYEPSNSSYRSRWFCVLKKDGKSLHPVHSLEPLNCITIQHSGVPPIPEHLAEQFGRRACSGMLDLYVGYDERLIAETSQDYTTFQTPFGVLRLVTLPMGWTNSVPIFHDDVTFILQAEIPHVTIPYIDEVPVKGPTTMYRKVDDTYETIPENPGICRFVWEHFQNLNRVVQRMKYCGGTFSGPKLFLCVPEIFVLGHRCTPEGRLPDESRVSAIRKWGPCQCQSLSEVHTFLGTVGVVQITSLCMLIPS
jgi:hypothetical protein